MAKSTYDELAALVADVVAGRESGMRCGRCSGNWGTAPCSSTRPWSSSAGGSNLIGVTGLSRTTVYEALETLAAWRLVEPRHDRWSITGRREPGPVGRAVRLPRRGPGAGAPSP